MHKRRQVARVLFVDAHPTDIISISDKEHMPPGVFNAETLVLWLNSRNMPSTRPFSDEVMNMYGISDAASYAGLSHNTSLTDCYWFADEDEIKSGLGWDQVDPRKTEWSLSGEAVFVGRTDLVKNLDCPDFGTSGFLPKVWVRELGTIYLLKRDGAEGLQTFSPGQSTFAAPLTNAVFPTPRSP